MFCLCIQKSVPMCEKSRFLIQTAYQRTVPEPLQKRRTVPTYRTRTITKKPYRTSVPSFLAKIEEYRTAPTYRTQGLREKIFQAVRRSIPGPQILLAPPSLIGAHPLNHFLSDGYRSSLKSEGITIFPFS